MVKQDLRVMMVLDEYNMGGTETYVLNLTKFLLKMGIYVVVIGRKGVLYEEFQKLNCPIYLVPFPFDTCKIVGQGPLSNQIQEIVKAEGIQLINYHAVLSADCTMKALQGLDIPTVFTVHGLYFADKILIPIAKKCNTVISVSEPVSNYLQRHGISSKLIYNGIDFQSFYNDPDTSVRKTLGIPTDAIVILYAGRLVSKKATICKMLLRACWKLRNQARVNIHVVIVGTGWSKKLQQFANNFNRGMRGKFVHSLGKKSDMQKWYSMSNCVVGTGRVAIEALACEKPVVAVGSSGCVGLVEPATYNDALRCYFGDHYCSGRHPENLVIARDLRRIIKYPPNINLGKEGREWAKNYFNIETISSQIAHNFYTIRDKSALL